MPGLVPGIHDLRRLKKGKAWMAGTSPAITVETHIVLLNQGQLSPSLRRTVIASAAKQSRAIKRGLDCFVASLLAMTAE